MQKLRGYEGCPLCRGGACKLHGPPFPFSGGVGFREFRVRGRWDGGGDGGRGWGGGEGVVVGRWVGLNPNPSPETQNPKPRNRHQKPQPQTLNATPLNPMPTPPLHWGLGSALFFFFIFWCCFPRTDAQTNCSVVTLIMHAATLMLRLLLLDLRCLRCWVPLCSDHPSCCREDFFHSSRLSSVLQLPRHASLHASRRTSSTMF